MDYIGKWVFESILQMDESGDMVRLTADAYLASPMPYVDESDPDEVASELRERKTLIGSAVEVVDDGHLYILMPLPEGVSQEEVDAAVQAGEIKLRNGMMYDRPMAWELRDGKLWYDTGIEGEVFGEAADPWAPASEEDGYLDFINIRYKRAE